MRLSSGLTIFLLLWLSACGADERRPNVVLITLDTTRADYLSCYGHPEETSPRLDAFAREGTRFDFALSTASVTPVSHASILTGRFNSDHGVRVIYAASGYRLAPDIPTLTTVLKNEGYRTIAVHSAFPVSGFFGFSRGFDVFESFDSAMNLVRGSAKWDQRNTRRSDETTDVALRALSSGTEPFFLWIHYWDPHDSIQLPPPEYLPPAHELYVMEDGRPTLDGKGRPVWKRPRTSLYAAEVRYMDAQIGRVFDRLKRDGLWEDTIVAVVADHGQGLGDHDWEAHRILYQEQIRVPLIVKGIGTPTVEVVDDLVRTVDVFPTLLDYAGVGLAPTVADQVAGRTLRPLMEGSKEAPRMAFAEQINGFDLNSQMLEERPYDDFLYCAMDRDWKLIWRPTRPEKSELFHLARDPREEHDLYAWDHVQAIRMKRALAERVPWVTEPFPAARATQNLQLEDAVQERLESLGYGRSGGAVDGPDWEWVCPEHRDARSSTPRPCARCGSAKILIARGA